MNHIHVYKVHMVYLMWHGCNIFLLFYLKVDHGISIIINQPCKKFLINYKMIKWQSTIASWYNSDAYTAWKYNYNYHTQLEKQN